MSKLKSPHDGDLYTAGIAAGRRYRSPGGGIAVIVVARAFGLAVSDSAW